MHCEMIKVDAGDDRNQVIVALRTRMHYSSVPIIIEMARAARFSLVLKYHNVVVTIMLLFLGTLFKLCGSGH